MRSRIAIVAFVLSALALVAAVWATISPIIVRQDAAAVQSQAKTLADQVAEACAKGGAVAQQLGQACAKAAEVKDQPPVAQAATEIDPAQLRAAARTAVLDYCSTRNGCRGPDGRTPDVDAIVDIVLTRVPEPKDGRDGRDAPTPDWAAQVAAYCGQAEEPCRGPTGQKGDNGETGAIGPTGPAGPTCPDGYELRDAVITARDGTTYSGKACVDPASSAPPSSRNPPPLGGS